MSKKKKVGTWVIKRLDGKKGHVKNIVFFDIVKRVQDYNTPSGQ